MKPALRLGEEMIPAEEPAQIAELVAILRAVQEIRDRRHPPVRRTVHPRQHGCVFAELSVEPGLPSALRHGVFREARTYPALVRFSNAKQPDDRLPDAHGLALKMLDVDGEKLPDHAHDDPTQDFVLVDHPVFFVRNVADFIPLAQDFRRLMTGGLLSKARTIVKAALSRDYRFRLIRQMAAKRPESPLEIQYWSTTPSKLGVRAMKFALRPHRDSPPAVTKSSPDKLGVALKEHLRARAARFDFLVQLQADPIRTPIEDPTIEWQEPLAPFEKVATLHIPRQQFDAPEQKAFAENMSFTPWHTLADHRPLGGVNRARRAVYAAMSARRRELNAAPVREPTANEVRAMWQLPV